MRKKTYGLTLLLILLVALVLGGIIGDAFSSSIPILAYGKSIGFDAVTIDLSVIQIILGFKMSINIAGIIGIVIALFIFKRF